ncbi:MAG: amino acid adenylation domain-containing protein [Acidobacteriota bacterium]
MLHQTETSVTGASPSYVFPASFAQQRLWFLDQLEPGTAVYNISRAVRLRARLDPAVFERSLREIVQRHEALRTVFRAERGEPFQVIANEGRLHLRVVDLRRVPPDQRDGEAERLAREDSRQPFDLSEGPLFRTTIVQISEEDFLFLLSIHHIVSDGWSLGILFGELAEVYDAFSRGLPSPLHPLPIQYADFAVWQRERMGGSRLEAEVAYWKKQLSGAPALLELPSDRPRPLVQTFRGSHVRSSVSPEIAAELRAFSRAEGATLFMTLLAGFCTLLCRTSGQSDVVVGTPVAGRSRTETEGLIGLFVNTLAIRNDLSGDPTFREVLRRVRAMTVDAYSHQEIPFEKVVEEVQPRRSLSHAPIVQVFFALENTPRRARQLPGLSVRPLEIQGDVARADLTIFMREEEDDLPYEIEFNADLFDSSTMRSFATQYETLLAAAVAEPESPISRLPVLTAVERARILGDCRGPAEPPTPKTTIPRLFEEAVRRAPGRVAVVCEGRRITYGELDHRADTIARALRERGVVQGSLVAVCVPRSIEMVAGILGVLKAGGAYVPIDPTYPAQRICWIVEDSGARLMLAAGAAAQGLERLGVETFLLDSGWPADAGAGEGWRDPLPEIRPDGLAYVIYTSGSTGRPKGVLIQHSGVANLFAGTSGELEFGEDDVWTIFHSFAFDLSVWEMWGPLLHGGRLVIVPVETAQTPLAFARLLRDEGVTVVSQTPAAARRLAAVRADPASGSADWRLKNVICGGEALPADLAAELLSWDVPLWNFYGPTEATVWTTIRRVSPGDCGGGFVSIGRPIANTAAYVLDPRREPVPDGVAGDLYLGGAGLARGYLHRPDLDAERFVPDPFRPTKGSALLYRTGDRARRRRAGDLEFLGRDDHQVKLRGYRVELGEIESALGEHPGVEAVAAIVREDDPGDRRLVAYFVPASNRSGPPSPDALRAFLLTRLPEYMVPQLFIPIDEIPLTSNTKVDRLALPAPAGTRPEIRKEFVPPRTASEEKLAEVWRRLLGIDRVGVDDDFFELGGHSLKAAQAIARIQEVFGVDLPLRQLFETPTVAGLALRIDGRRDAKDERSDSPIMRADRSRPLPLSFGQQRLWFLDQLEPGSAAYNICRAVRIRGPLDRAVFREALEEVMARHESLRTTFEESDGRPHQKVLPRGDVPLAEDTAGGLGREEIDRLVSEECARPFDLARGPLWRVLRIETGPLEHIVVFTIHHIVSDGWSLGVFFGELGQIYAGRISGGTASLPALSIQYPDYAAWQRDGLRGEKIDGLLDYWKTRLAGAPKTLALAGARPRLARPGSGGAIWTQRLTRELTESVDALGRSEATTRYTTLLAVFQVLLSETATDRDVVVGTDVANRDRIETERLIGFFVNLLPIRTDLSGNPRFREALARVREATLGAYAHQELPFERLVEELRPERVPGVNPLVQVLVVQSASGDPLRLPGLIVEEYPVPVETSRFDLVLFLGEKEKRIVATWLYNTDILEPAAVERLAERFERLLRAVVADPDSPLEILESLTDSEKRPGVMEKKELREVQAKGLRGARRERIEIGRAAQVVEESVAGTGGGRFPLVLRPEAGAELDLAEWAAAGKERLEAKLLEHGSLLFRGFGTRDAAEFERVAGALCRGELFGEYGDLPREAVGGRVYGSTPYPPDQPILFHNESSHMHRWPMKIWFFCVTPSARGGETPIVDCRRVYERLDPALQRRFTEKGLVYVRNYTEGLDVSWESFYGTSDRARVEEICRAAGTEFDWRPDNGLRTRQRCPAVVRHPVTGELAFFNQLQLHHVSCLEPAVRESLSSLMKEEDLPRNVYYGDGSPIEDSVMEEVGRIYRESAVAFPWQSGDVLMLNNMLVAHSRNPYEGERKIVVAMAEMVQRSEVDGG